MLSLSATEMARGISRGEISSLELMTAHLQQIERLNPSLNATVAVLRDQALAAATQADRKLAAKEQVGPLHGVPVSIKDSIDVRGTRCTAGTLGRRNASPAERDATLVVRLRSAGAIPIAKTNLPDLLFAYESDNLIFGRTNNPYDQQRTAGGSSGGESALIAACGSPLGLGSDAAGSVRIPAHFCGIASIKPTSGRFPRTGHVPPAGGWIERLWQIGPMARRVEDLALAMKILSGPDGEDFTVPPVPIEKLEPERKLRVAFFTDNGFSQTGADVVMLVEKCARFLSDFGHAVKETKPPRVEQAYELEMALLGADGGEGIDSYLKEAGSYQVHPMLTDGFLSRMRPFKTDVAGLNALWGRWDQYRADLTRFFEQYDVILCPIYTQAAFKHGESVLPGNFEGFSYAMAWNVAGTPAAVVRCGEDGRGLPLNIQVVARPWADMTALAVCQMLESAFGGWKAPKII